MCNIFNSQFLSVFANENINQIPDINQVFNGSDDLLNTIQVSCDEVTKEIDRLKPNTSPGPDEEFARVLKECKEELSQPLTQLFNQSLNEGVVPDSWKTANVVPIFKKGDKSLASNYRPISLTSLVGKILESIIAKKNQTSFRKV